MLISTGIDTKNKRWSGSTKCVVVVAMVMMFVALYLYEVVYPWQYRVSIYVCLFVL